MTSAHRIRDLNDAFRQGGQPVDWFMTAGIHALGAAFAHAALQKVKAFCDFTEDNDPYGEHDFGSLTVFGLKVFWKIDCYDLNLEFGSPDPGDPSVTRRVMTIMLASEY